MLNTILCKCHILSYFDEIINRILFEFNIFHKINSGKLNLRIQYTKYLNMNSKNCIINSQCDFNNKNKV